MQRRPLSTLLAALVASLTIGVGAVSAQTAGSTGSAGATSGSTGSATGSSATGSSSGSDASRSGASARADRSDRAANDEWQRRHRVSKIIGTDVRNPQGEKVGDIKDVVIDNTGRISYLVVSAGGFLGIGDKLFAVPYNQFQTGASRDHLVLNVDKARMKNAQGFDEHNWPNMADSNWINENNRHYGSAARGTSSSSTSERGTTTGSTTDRGTGSNRTGTTTGSPSGRTSSTGNRTDVAGQSPSGSAR